MLHRYFTRRVAIGLLLIVAGIMVGLLDRSNLAALAVLRARGVSTSATVEANYYSADTFSTELTVTYVVAGDGGAWEAVLFHSSGMDQPPGSQVAVVYDPHDPAVVLLRQDITLTSIALALATPAMNLLELLGPPSTGFTESTLPFAVPGLAVIAVGVVVSVRQGRHWRRQWRLARAPDAPTSPMRVIHHDLGSKDRGWRSRRRLACILAPVTAGDGTRYKLDLIPGNPPALATLEANETVDVLGDLTSRSPLAIWTPEGVLWTKKPATKLKPTKRL
jgi:hypothetical protein